MSDTIEVTVPSSTVAVGEQNGAETAASPAARIPAKDLVRLAQGFYCIFWGLLVGVLTATQLLIAEEQRALADMFLAASVLSTLVGTWRLTQAKSVGEMWRRRTRPVLGLSALLIYFCAMFYMWRRVPANAYLLANALAFPATCIFYIILFTRAVAALARALGRTELLIESRVFSAGNVGFLLLPFFSALVYVVVQMMTRGSDLAVELQRLLTRSNILLVILLLLPFSLTLSLAWAAKDAALRQLASMDRDKRDTPGR